MLREVGGDAESQRDRADDSDQKDRSFSEAQRTARG